MTTQETFDLVMSSFDTPELMVLNEIKEVTLKKIAEEWLESQGLTEEDIINYGDDLKKMVDDFIKEKEKQINNAINQIKLEFNNIKNGITAIQTQVKSIIANIAMPAMVTVPPGVPNPLHTINDISQKKGLLNKILFDLNMSSAKLLNAAIQTDLELPAGILGVIASIADMKKLINSIPIPTTG